jgi:hypothetical protein
MAGASKQPARRGATREGPYAGVALPFGVHASTMRGASGDAGALAFLSGGAVSGPHRPIQRASSPQCPSSKARLTCSVTVAITRRTAMGD